jgi:hypothetical protein
MREIAEVIGKGLKVPVVSLSREEAQAHFGWLAMFAGSDMPASSGRRRGRSARRCRRVRRFREPSRLRAATHQRTGHPCQAPAARRALQPVSRAPRLRFGVVSEPLADLVRDVGISPSDVNVNRWSHRRILTKLITIPANLCRPTCQSKRL